MSDRDLSYSPPPIGGKTRKRKPAGNSTTTKAKRTKTSQPAPAYQHLLDPFANAKDDIRKALASPDSFALPGDEEVMRSLVVSISKYAKSLEESAKTGLAPKAPEQIAAEAKRVASMVKSGISNQMPWRDTCKEGRAKFVYDGYCPDPRVFGAMIKLNGPPQCKTYKFTQEEFCRMVGRVENEVRYATLVLTSDVKIEWNAETGEFVIRGKYGKRQ